VLEVVVSILVLIVGFDNGTGLGCKIVPMSFPNNAVANCEEVLLSNPISTKEPVRNQVDSLWPLALLKYTIIRDVR
jgi:hypothetical protein